MRQAKYFGWRFKLYKYHYLNNPPIIITEKRLTYKLEIIINAFFSWNRLRTKRITPAWDDLLNDQHPPDVSACCLLNYVCCSYVHHHKFNISFVSVAVYVYKTTFLTYLKKWLMWYGAGRYGVCRTCWNGSSFDWRVPCKNQTALQLHHLVGFSKRCKKLQSLV